MATLINIIEKENKILEEVIENEYNKALNIYEKELKDAEKKRNDNYNLIYKTEKSIPNLKKEHIKDSVSIFINNLINFVIIGGWITIFMYMWINMGFGIWSFIFSLIIMIFIGGATIWFIELFDFDLGFNLKGSHIPKVIVNNLKLIETTKSETKELELYQKTLKSNPPKRDDFVKLYNTKEFFKKMSVSKLTRNIDFDLQSLIGQYLNFAIVQEFLRKIDIQPEISKFDDGYFYGYKSLGFDISFSNENQISGIFLFSEGSDGHAEFYGKIPYNIKITDTQKMLYEKLGNPDVYNDGVSLRYGDYATWKSKGLMFTFNPENKENKNNTIHHILLSKFN